MLLVFSAAESPAIPGQKYSCTQYCSRGRYSNSLRNLPYSFSAGKVRLAQDDESST